MQLMKTYIIFIKNTDETTNGRYVALNEMKWNFKYVIEVVQISNMGNWKSVIVSMCCALCNELWM